MAMLLVLTGHADVVFLSALRPGAVEVTVVLADIGKGGVVADGRTGLGLGGDLHLPAVRNELSVSDLKRIGAGIHGADQLLAVPLEDDHDGRRAAARNRVLTAPRTVERITFLRIRQSSGCKQHGCK